MHLTLVIFLQKMVVLHFNHYFKKMVVYTLISIYKKMSGCHFFIPGQRSASLPSSAGLASDSHITRLVLIRALCFVWVKYIGRVSLVSDPSTFGAGSNGPNESMS